MRSSVSVILSDPPSESAMSYPDYQQTALDHRCLLVLVKQVGEHMKTRTFNRLYERICRVQNVRVQDSSGAARCVHVRHRRSYPTVNNEWGEFQSHRRVLALVTVGQVSCQSELNEVCAQHEQLRARYASTLLDSRCLVLGAEEQDGCVTSSAAASADDVTHGRSVTSHAVSRSAPHSVGSSRRRQTLARGSVHVDGDSGVYDHSEHGLSSLSETTSSSSSASGSDECSDHEDGATCASSRPAPSPSQPAAVQLCPPSASKARLLFHDSLDSCCRRLDEQLHELYAALFWVLEARRVERCSAGDRSSCLLCAPFERKDFVGLDMESRSNRRRCQGRLRKHLADLTLQTGLASQALTHYTTAASLLRQSNDWLWLAGCFEGMCACSVAMLYPDLRSNEVKRIGSLNHTRVDKAGRRVVSAVQSLPAIASACIDNAGCHGNNDGDVSAYQQQQCLSPADIVSKYHEAVVHYSKYRHAAVVETECSLKAVHVLIEQGRVLTAAEFLQNVAFINLQLFDDEKIQRFAALSELYELCGFRRKAAFFRRVSAMRHVAQQNPRPSWPSCHQLLMLALEGYRLSLDAAPCSKTNKHDGWAFVQTQLLQELVGSARRAGNTCVAMRHLAYLLHAMFWQLAPPQRSELALQLETLVAQCVTSSQSPACETTVVPLCQPLVLHSGVILPPMQLHTLPVVRHFCPLPYAAHLNPVRVKCCTTDGHIELVTGASLTASSGPFIYSALPTHSRAVSNTNNDRDREDFLWVQGELSQVEMAVENLLSVDLRVTGVCMLTEEGGAAMDQYPSSLSLAAHSGQHMVNLVGAPRSATVSAALAPVTIVGYTATVLGCRVSCRLRSVAWLTRKLFRVDVVPPLPHVQVSSSISGLPGSSPFDLSGVVNAGNMHVYNGESREMYITLKNTSTEPINALSIVLEQAASTSSRKVFECDVTQLESHLPLCAGHSCTLSVQVNGHADIVLPSVAHSEGMDSVSVCESLTSAAQMSLSSRAPSFVTSATSDACQHSACCASTVAPSVVGGSSCGCSCMPLGGANHHCASRTQRKWASGKCVEGMLRVCYSGGVGQTAGYGRAFSVGLSATVLPSVCVTKWDVIAAECPSLCYLVLDMMNVSDGELELQYTDTKSIVIESGETRRIAVPVDRLNAVSCCYQSHDAQNLAAVYERVSSHVSRRVNLRWKMTATACGTTHTDYFPPQPRLSDSPGHQQQSRYGVVPMTDIMWSPVMINTLSSPALHWVVAMNGAVLGGEGSDNSCGPLSVGQLHELRVRVKNGRDSALTCVLLVRCELEQQLAPSYPPQPASRGVVEAGCMLVVGQTSSSAIMEAGGELCHALSVMFLAPGRYRVVLSVSTVALSTGVCSSGASGTDACDDMSVFCIAVDVVI